MRRPHMLGLVTVAALVALAGCGGGADNKTAGKGGDRPTTTARLAIVSPTAGQITGPDVDVKLRLDGGTIVPATNTKLVPDGGHIHAYVDDQLLSMTYGLEQQLTGLKPGPHSLRAEFVAADHAPFNNRVVASVLFQVQQP